MCYFEETGVQNSILWCIILYLEKKKESQALDWTSPGGSDKKKVLAKLPQYFSDILPSTCCKTIAKLWKVHVCASKCKFIRYFIKDFEDLYSSIGSWMPDADEVERKVGCY